MTDLALLVLRATVGTLLAGHGAQKLFGWFGGHGLKGTAGFLESLNMKPGHFWASMAGLSEFGGGVLTVLGFLNPIGPIGAVSAMIMATVKAHWGKPIWASSGGAELPVINLAAATAVALAGPGRFSLDHMLRIRVPAWAKILTLLAAAASIVIGTKPELIAPQPIRNEGDISTVS